MIKTKEDLIEYLNKDMKRYGNTKPDSVFRISKQPKITRNIQA